MFEGFKSWFKKRKPGRGGNAHVLGKERLSYKLLGEEAHSRGDSAEGEVLEGIGKNKLR